MPKVLIDVGDLTTIADDAIVNAANPAMLGGGGVDGAIHAAAGPKLLVACRSVPKDGLGVRCPTGEARITEGFDLPARYVIHTVGPVYRDHDDPAALLASAHRNALKLAVEHGLRTVAFPAISCGVFGYPAHEAADVALGVATEADWDLDHVRFVHFTRGTYEAWRAEADRRGITG
ncbi:MAG: O-acetyl-ADP-ribose deacetylase [Myxococcota bacterium]